MQAKLLFELKFDNNQYSNEIAGFQNDRLSYFIKIICFAVDRDFS